MWGSSGIQCGVILVSACLSRMVLCSVERSGRVEAEANVVFRRERCRFSEHRKFCVVDRYVTLKMGWLVLCGCRGDVYSVARLFCMVKRRAIVSRM